MSFRLNTNTAADNAYGNLLYNQRQYTASLEKISSGLRINSAADDPAGMITADSLRAQASSFEAALKNVNEGIGMLQVADAAIGEQISIAESMKVLAIQAAQDSQTLDTRKALQNEFDLLKASFNKIANETSFNTVPLLSGSYTKSYFQVGAYSNEALSVSIPSLQSGKVGSVNYSVYNSQLYHNDAALPQTMNIGFIVKGNEITLASAVVGTGEGEGLGAVADIINAARDLTNISADYEVRHVGFVDQGKVYMPNIQAGTLPADFTINGVNIGALTVQDNDSDGTLVQAINDVSQETGVTASLTPQGQLVLSSDTGRAISVTPHHANTKILGDIDNYIGNLKLTNHGVEGVQLSSAMQTSLDNLNMGNGADVITGVGAASELHYFRNLDLVDLTGQKDLNKNLDESGALDGTKFNRAMDAIMDSIDIIDQVIAYATQQRANVGAMMKQFESAGVIDTQMPIYLKEAESNIRDTDFAKEVTNFTKADILTQAGSFALSQANVKADSVLKLLMPFDMGSEQSS